MALSKGGLCRVPRIRRSTKRIFFEFFQKFPLWRVPSQGHSAKVFQKKCNFFNSSLCRVSKLLGTRQRHFKKILNLCRAPCQGHSAKYFPKKNLYRVPNSRHSAKKDVAEHRYAGQPMPSAALLPGARHSAKKAYAECRAFAGSPTLGKEGLCRVPDF